VEQERVVNCGLMCGCMGRSFFSQSVCFSFLHALTHNVVMNHGRSGHSRRKKEDTNGSERGNEVKDSFFWLLSDLEGVQT